MPIKIGKKDDESDQEKVNEIYRNLAALRHESPDSPESQVAIKEWYDF